MYSFYLNMDKIQALATQGQGGSDSETHTTSNSSLLSPWRLAGHSNEFFWGRSLELSQVFLVLVWNRTQD